MATVYERTDSGVIVIEDDEQEDPVEEQEYTNDTMMDDDPPDFSYNYNSDLSDLDPIMDQDTTEQVPASQGYDLGDYPVDDTELLYDPFDPSNYTSTTYNSAQDDAYWEQFGGKPTNNYDPEVPS